VTFKNCEKELLEVVCKVPANRLLIETDAPFLAPHPYRGTTCVPGHVAATLCHIAKLRNVSVDELTQDTFQNSIEMFQL
jgi:TatD DNase family protein